MKNQLQSTKIPVGILGATGTVGQRFIQLLHNHPWFEVTEVAASERSAGKKYADAVNWKMSTPIPESVRNLTVKTCEENLDCTFIFCGLDANVAKDIEETFAKNGYPVITNARCHRFDKDIPLLVPEVNADHIEIIEKQKQNRGWNKGFIVTNPNCIAVPLSLALKPIQDAFGIEKIFIATLQAISGSGYPGVPSLDIVDNVIPCIGGEEPKVESEPIKILGKLKNDNFENADIKISAHCNRVAVRDGHILNISFSTKEKTSVNKIKKVLKEFRAEPQKFNLPSAPERPIIVHEDEYKPQPITERNLGNGMSISIGRIRECNLLDFRMVVLGHNTIRGAAGAAILNAELLHKKGYINE